MIKHNNVKSSLLWDCLHLQLPFSQWSASGTLGCISSKLPVGAELSQALTQQLQKLEFQFSSVAQLCPTLCDPMNRSMPGLPVHHQLPEVTQTHIHRVGDAIQPSRPPSSPSLPALNLSQHQGVFQWVSSLRQVAKVLEFQLQHWSFQWIVRTDFL